MSNERRFIGVRRVRWIGLNLPIHASWLNQIEIYFSILQRNVLTPKRLRRWPNSNEPSSTFERYYAQIAESFEWKFTRADLTRLLARLTTELNPSSPIALAA